MKLLFLPATDVDAGILEDTINFLLTGFVAAPGQSLVSTDELVQLASRSIKKENVDLIRRSRVQVQLKHWKQNPLS